jgi:hypothetical protein
MLKGHTSNNRKLCAYIKQPQILVIDKTKNWTQNKRIYLKWINSIRFSINKLPITEGLGWLELGNTNVVS